MITAPMRDPDFESSRFDGIVHVDLCAHAETGEIYMLEFSPDGEPDQNGERGIAITAIGGPFGEGYGGNINPGGLAWPARGVRYVDWASEQCWRYIETLSTHHARVVWETATR
jgi:hypothetical protein